MGGGLLACDATEYSPDGHPESSQIALTKDGPRHNFARRPDIGQLHTIGLHPRGIVHFEAKIGEGDAGAQFIGVERGGSQSGAPSWSWAESDFVSPDHQVLAG